MNLKRLFLNHCKTKKLEINTDQLTTIDNINKYNQNN